MSDYAIPTIFVAQSGTLASAGSTDALTPGQIGLFRDDYSIATSGNIAAAPYFYIGQGRKFPIPGVGSKRSDKISAPRVTKWYKYTAEDTAANEIQTISGWQVKCGDVVHVQISGHSNQMDDLSNYGLTRSVTALAPCCDCGELPCENVDAADVEAMVDSFVKQINATWGLPFEGTGQLVLSTYFSAYKTGTGNNSVLNISSKPVPSYSNPFDPTAYPFEYDRVWFNAIAFKNPDTTSDFYVQDRCETVATSAITQRSTYQRGSSNEVKLMERWYFSTQSPEKYFYSEGEYNSAFESFVQDGTFYDMYYIKFASPSENYSWLSGTPMDAQVIVYFPTGTGTAFETALTAALGSPKDISGQDQTTTTTTSTSSTSTTSTTIQIP